MQYGNLTTAEQDAFKRHQAANGRVPTFSVFLEEQGDISSYCKAITCNALIQDSLHQPSYGRGNITLQNKDGAFTEAGKPTIGPGSKIKVFAGFDNDNIPIWKGTVTEAKPTTDMHEVVLSIAQFGGVLNNVHTSGDYSAYNTPKTLINRLCQLAGLSAPVYQNESGQPTTYTFGNDYIETNKSYWAIVHGATFCIFYVPYFDVNGVLNLRRRSDFTDADFLFDDSNIISIESLDKADLINNKVIDYGNPVRFEFTLGDNVTFGQRTRRDSNSYSQSQWGEDADYETDELVGTWTKAGTIIDEVMDYYPYLKYLYRIKAEAVPQLELLDRPRVKTVKHNIEGKFVVLGRRHEIRPGYYVTTDTLMSEGERF